MGKKGKKKNKKDVDDCDPEHFDEDLKIVYVEYGLDSPIFKEKAHMFFKELTEKFPDEKFKFVENRPRNGSFEIKLARNCRLPAKKLWSGIEREPRLNKFPENFDKIYNDIKTMLKHNKEQ